MCGRGGVNGGKEGGTSAIFSTVKISLRTKEKDIGPDDL